MSSSRESQLPSDVISFISVFFVVIRYKENDRGTPRRRGRRQRPTAAGFRSPSTSSGVEPFPGHPWLQTTAA